MAPIFTREKIRERNCVGIVLSPDEIFRNLYFSCCSAWTHKKTAHAGGAERDEEQRASDIFLGKCSEWAYYKMRFSVNKNFPHPNMSILGKSKHDDGADFIHDGVVYSVKGTSENGKYYTSPTIYYNKHSIPQKKAFIKLDKHVFMNYSLHGRSISKSITSKIIRDIRDGKPEKQILENMKKESKKFSSAEIKFYYRGFIMSEDFAIKSFFTEKGSRPYSENCDNNCCHEKHFVFCDKVFDTLSI